MTNANLGGFGGAIRALRLAAHMTIEQVAEDAGVSPSYLSRAENNQVTPSPEWVKLVTLAIGERLRESA